MMGSFRGKAHTSKTGAHAEMSISEEAGTSRLRSLRSSSAQNEKRPPTHKNQTKTIQVEEKSKLGEGSVIQQHPAFNSLNQSPHIPTKFNEISAKYNEENKRKRDQLPHIGSSQGSHFVQPHLHAERRRIRLLSLTDIKPINPYITLLTLKDFTKREQELTAIGLSSGAGGIDEQDKKSAHKENYFKILGEELNERLHEKMTALGYSGEEVGNQSSSIDGRSLIAQKIKERQMTTVGGKGGKRGDDEQS